jgi:hypothetical protein
MKCLNCQVENSNPKFCSKSCAASYNNRINPKRLPESRCKNCSQLITSNKTFCSVECKTNYRRSIPLESKKLCTSCHKEFDNNKNFFYERKNRKTLQPECKQCFKDRGARRVKEQRKLGVEYKGGKCVLCGYENCIAGLDFHHLDPSQKEMEFKSAWINLKRLFKELDKCILVCSTCHREIHYGLHPQYLVVKEQIVS